jgi:hypothetical protein
VIVDTCPFILARLSSRSDQRLCIKAPAAGGWEAAQPAPARDGGTFKAAAARHGRGAAGSRFLRSHLRGFRRRSHRRSGRAFTRQWHPFPTPCWNLRGQAAPSRFRARRRLYRNPRRRQVRAVHHGRFRYRHSDPGRRWHTVRRADRIGDRHKGQAKAANSWTPQHVLSRHAILSKAVASIDALSSCFTRGWTRSCSLPATVRLLKGVAAKRHRKGHHR